MKVSELIEILQTMRQDLDVKYVYDGALRNNIKLIWETRSGKIALSDRGEYVNGDDCPQDFHGSSFRVWDVPNSVYCRKVTDET